MAGVWPFYPGGVRQERARSAALYGLTATVAAAGATAFVVTAPRTGENPRVVAGRRTVERLIPDSPLQTGAETMVLAGGSRAERNTPVPGGSFTLTMACAGEGRIRVRLSTTTVDSGRAVRCAAEPGTVELEVGLASMFFLSVAAESESESVFRWRITRANSF